MGKNVSGIWDASHAARAASTRRVGAHFPNSLPPTPGGTCTAAPWRSCGPRRGLSARRTPLTHVADPCAARGLDRLPGGVLLGSSIGVHLPRRAPVTPPTCITAMWRTCGPRRGLSARHTPRTHVSGPCAARELDPSPVDARRGAVSDVVVAPLGEHGAHHGFTINCHLIARQCRVLDFYLSSPHLALPLGHHGCTANGIQIARERSVFDFYLRGCSNGGQLGHAPRLFDVR